MLSLLETMAIAEVATRTVEAIMRKPTSAERREAFFKAYDAADPLHRRAIFGVAATMISRQSAVPPIQAGGGQP